MIRSLAVLAMVTLATAAAAEPPRADADDRDQVALGAKVYRESCAACHGVRLEGEADWQRRRPDGRLPAPPHDGSGHSWHHPDQLLFDVTKHGPQFVAGPGYESDMPAFDGILSDAEIWAAIAYIKSTWPEEIQERHRRVNERHHGQHGK